MSTPISYKNWPILHERRNSKIAATRVTITFVVRSFGFPLIKKFFAYQCYFGTKIVDPYRPLEAPPSDARAAGDLYPGGCGFTTAPAAHEIRQSPRATASAKARSPDFKSSSASAAVPKTRARFSSNSPSHRATTIVARQFPIRFTQVRPMSINSSTPKITATPICKHHHDLPVPAHVLTGCGFGCLRHEH